MNPAARQGFFVYDGTQYLHSDTSFPAINLRLFYGDPGLFFGFLPIINVVIPYNTR